MGIYASRPARMVGQVLTDVFVIVWGIFWAVVGVVVDRSISVLATPARETARTARTLVANFRDAADQAARVPGVGDQLRRPFDAASTTLGSLIASADQQVTSIEHVARLTGWLAFLIPVATVVLIWLPRRVRFYRDARASQRFLDAAPDLEVFALRAIANQPLAVLARISDDPVGDWRSGDRTVIEQLAALEIRRSGLRFPSTLRQSEAGPSAEGTTAGDALSSAADEERSDVLSPPATRR